MARAIADIRRDRLRHLIDTQFEGRQIGLAVALSKAPNYISRLLSKEKQLGERLSREIEAKLGLPTFWLDQDPAPPETGDRQADAIGATLAATFSAPIVPIPRKRVPLIPLSRAGSTRGLSQAALYEWREQWVSVPMIEPSETSFAVRVPKGLEPAFQADSLLVIDPQLAPADRDFLLVAFGQGEPTVRQLVTDGDLQLLAHPVPGFPMRPRGDARVVGVVIQHIRNFR